MILKKYKNEIFNTLKASQFSLDDFDVKDFKKALDNEQELSCLSIQLKGTPFEFILRNSGAGFNQFDYAMVMFTPQMELSEFYPEQSWTGFDTVIKELDRWLGVDLKEYLEERDAPDLWEEFKKGNKSLDFQKMISIIKTNFLQTKGSKLKCPLMN